MNIYYVAQSSRGLPIALQVAMGHGFGLERLATTFVNNPGYPRRLIVNADDFGVVPTVIFAVCVRVWRRSRGGALDTLPITR